MTIMTIERDGKLALPPDIQERSGLLPETAVRVIETRDGILLVPLTDAPMSADLTEELQDRHRPGQEALAKFSYKKEDKSTVGCSAKDRHRQIMVGIRLMVGI